MVENRGRSRQMGHGELRIIEATFESYSFCPADPVNLGRLP
jgi:hypothetical protein